MTERSCHAAVTGAFLVNWLVRLYTQFGGDILEAVVLGELALGVHRGAPVHPNASAIANATGIPRETIRRKLAALQVKGWVKRDAGGRPVLTSAARRRIARLTLDLRLEVLQLSDGIRRSGRIAARR